MKRIYIEGKNNPLLRQAFSELLRRELSGIMPKVVLGNGISETVSKFRTSPIEEGEERYLIVDSDEEITNRSNLVKRVNGKSSQKNCIMEATDDNTFFMVQEVEAWILSQPDALKERKVIKGLPLNNIESIKKPSEKLAEIYKMNGKQYNKTREFSAVFKYIDSKKLKEFSSEYKALIDKLK